MIRSSQEFEKLALAYSGHDNDFAADFLQIVDFTPWTIVWCPLVERIDMKYAVTVRSAHHGKDRVRGCT